MAAPNNPLGDLSNSILDVSQKLAAVGNQSATLVAPALQQQLQQQGAAQTAALQQLQQQVQQQGAAQTAALQQVQQQGAAQTAALQQQLQQQGAAQTAALQQVQQQLQQVLQQVQQQGAAQTAALQQVQQQLQQVQQHLAARDARDRNLAPRQLNASRLEHDDPLYPLVREEPGPDLGALPPAGAGFPATRAAALSLNNAAIDALAAFYGRAFGQHGPAQLPERRRLFVQFIQQG